MANCDLSRRQRGRDFQTSPAHVTKQKPTLARKKEIVGVFQPKKKKGACFQRASHQEVTGGGVTLKQVSINPGPRRQVFEVTCAAADVKCAKGPKKGEMEATRSSGKASGGKKKMGVTTGGGFKSKGLGKGKTS